MDRSRGSLLTLALLLLSVPHSEIPSNSEKVLTCWF